MIILFYVLLAALDEEGRSFIEDLYSKYGSYMYKVALDVLHRKQDAEDAVMDAMCKIMKYISKFEGATDNEIRNQVVIGIRITVERKAIDHYNARKKRSAVETDWDYRAAEDDEYIEMEFADASSNADAILITEENRRTVQKALLHLPQGQRDAIDLTYFGGYSYEEAADFLGISDGALRARLYKARSNLKEMLRGEFCEQYEKG